jgi:transposase
MHDRATLTGILFVLKTGIPWGMLPQDCRHALRSRGIKGRIARKGKESSERLGRHRWVVERTLVWLARYRRLKVRSERRTDV